VAGVYEAPSGPGAIPALAKAPDWTYLRGVVDGHALHLEDQDSIEHRRVLDLRQGILWREWRHRDPNGRITRLRFLRLVSLADRHALVQCAALMAENYSGPVLLEGRFAPAPRGAGDLPTPQADLLACRIVPVTAGDAPPLPGVVLERRTEGSGVTLAVAAMSRLQGEEGRQVEPETKEDDGCPSQRWVLEAEIGKTYRLDQLVSLYTSRDTPRPAEQAVAHLGQLRTEGVRTVLEAHVRAWAERWQAADVRVDGDPEAQHALRFAAYHLVGAANPEDDRASVAARGLTGEAYKGHVFWDTEIYMIPFYVFTHPPTARALVMYRYHTLPAARAKARALGYHGALYAWESADSGDETTPAMVLAPDGRVVRILSGEQEHHISADVAYAVWHYWQASGGDAFLLEAGAEVLLETARFWASRGRFGPDGLYHIARVIGPDEYHEGVDDNACTNVLAQWNLERAVEAARLLEERWPERRRELYARLQIGPEEPAQWGVAAEKMYTGLDPQTLLFEQFRGYFGLEEIDLAAYEPRTAPMDVVLGRERTQRSQVIKQADVVLLMHLLWDRFAPGVREANFRYYEPRTGHGSSLSPAVHAVVAARLGEVALAERYFRQAAEIDLGNGMGNAAGGVHLANLGGLWQAAVMGFAGMALRPDGLGFAPCLPSRWRRLAFRVCWRNREVSVVLGSEPRTIEVQVEGPGSIAVALADGAAASLVPGRRYASRRENGRWEPLQEVSQ
jgi:kojibiose phosphorylase